MKENREEFIEACNDAQDEMQKAKEQGWRDLIEDCMTEPKAGKMWEVINSLKGSPNTNSPNEAMHHNGRTITSNRKKADLYVSHYAQVSQLTHLQ